jgi:hypothetical protein
MFPACLPRQTNIGWRLGVGEEEGGERSSSLFLEISVTNAKLNLIGT